MNSNYYEGLRPESPAATGTAKIRRKSSAVLDAPVSRPSDASATPGKARTEL